MSSFPGPSPKTRKTKLSRLRDIFGRKPSHPSFSHSSARDSINNALNDNTPGFQDDNSIMSKVQTDFITPLVLPTSHPSPEPSNYEPKSSNKFKKGLGVAWNALETALRILEKSADAFPPLKSCVGGLVALLDLGEAVAENDEEYEKLATELTSIVEILTPHVHILAEQGVSDSIARIVESINIESTYIKEQQDRNRMVRTTTAFQDQGDVIQRYRRIDSLFRQLQEGLLKDMSPVYDARYDSTFSTTINRRGCTVETREKVLNDLKDWVGDSKRAKICWMNGMAGTGKSTISYTLCQWLKKNSLLGGNYFCSRSSALCRNVDNIVPTLAHQLAQYSHSFRSKLCIVLEKEPGACKLNIEQQFKKLIQMPLEEMKTAMPDNVIIVIDALDECDDGSAFRLFLDTFLTLSINLPIKFFITSRPEPAIRDKMLASHHSDSLYLHDIEESIVAADIRKYFTEALGSMFPAPSSDGMEQLVKSAGKLFIYAVTIVRYICPGDSDVDHAARLQTVLGTVSGSTKQYHDLDELYTNILSTAINPPKRREEDEIEDILLILKTVVCAKEPMTSQTLASLLGRTEKRVRLSLQPLQSVLHTQDSAETTIAPFHTSFPDFLFDERRSKQFHCETTSHNEHLTKCCFRLMKEQLKFNICKLESSFVWDENVPDLPERIKSSISPALSYTCRYWCEYLLQGDFTDAVHEGLDEFLRNRLLFWMEVVNLHRCILKGYNGLIDIKRRYYWERKDQYSDTIEQLADAAEFIDTLLERFTSFIRSTPHIYISGLAFCPKTSSVYKNYRGHARGLIELKRTEVKYLKNLERAGLVLSVAFSPDGTRIVSASDDRSIRVWDALTGDIVAGPFNGHTGLVLSVGFSPDGTRIVSGSHDGGIRVWDALTGDIVAGPFNGHTGLVLSVGFSPDGTRIVSGCDDRSIRVWDALTGDIVAGPFNGHTDWVRSVGFSPDGTRIVSGSHDGSIRVWDALTGDIVAGPFNGHTDWVRSVGFSPDGTRIMSGSHDGSIRVCDALTGDIVAGPFNGHTDLVLSVGFSPDGTRIVSGCDDGSIRVWDALTGDIVAGPFKGHTGRVHSVGFSPDGTRIVSGSHDENIRVWDAHAGLFMRHMKAGSSSLLSHSLFSHSELRNFSVDQYIFKEGWITAGDALLFVPRRFRTQLLFAGNILAIGPDGVASINDSIIFDLSKPFIGETWSQCYR
ncbi:hypothetical protein Clacol_006387 [Clathrus columnatus]|uniref:Nephrocystin 3-like N-terminal domain-containing protein n=1 Tax=Clathrus columnatus TaxID=1419009 RepID=A0AAV5AGQ3_9AGAM|nr:hypothetical protein Clacol_006387 [Clathrus columnatus]